MNAAEQDALLFSTAIDICKRYGMSTHDSNWIMATLTAYKDQANESEAAACELDQIEAILDGLYIENPLPAARRVKAALEKA